MIDSAAKWFSGQWLEIASLLIANAALFYARQALHSSVASAEQARAAELTSLRIQAKAGLDDAQRSLIALRTNCQANCAEWQSYEFQHLPTMARMKSPMQSSPSDKVQNRGQIILQKLSQSFAALETMTTAELEKLLHEARTASLQIMALVSDLEAPPTYYK